MEPTRLDNAAHELDDIVKQRAASRRGQLRRRPILTGRGLVGDCRRL